MPITATNEDNSPLPHASFPEETVVPRTGPPWDKERPHVLVIACSDGRLQESLDDFLRGSLGITRYDRLYTPGGPGALATHGVEYLRADQYRRECAFLVEAHGIEDIFLILHGPAEDGPDEAICADYRRVFPRATAQEIRVQQERDITEVLTAGFGWKRPVRVHVYRCEVTQSTGTRFTRFTLPPVLAPAS